MPESKDNWRVCVYDDTILITGNDGSPIMATIDPRLPDAVSHAHRISATNEMCEALEGLLSIIDAAGLSNLSNGVQLGPTVWFVKASDAIKLSEAALAKANGET